MDNVRVLVVGAGGIGCELLKNLVLSGIRKLTVVDLDSIDVSNLNRQFLFRKNDVSHGKALVASKAVRRYLSPEEAEKLHITIHTERVQNLPMEVFANQDIVMNALDNFEARRYVNRICVAQDLPLIESGSTGNNGQVFPIWSKVGTECFECRDQPVLETFPVCTVRLTPEKPEHCVAWGRYLLEVIYGPPDSNNVLADLSESLMAQATSDDPSDYAVSMATALFDTAIKELAETADFKDAAMTPEPLSVKEKTQTLDLSEIGKGTQIVKATQKEAQDVQSVERTLAMFLDAAASLKHRGEEIKFDKDDDMAMAFVAAAAGLRMRNYHIDPISLWAIKSIAGSIQPAIAATNAMVAGLQVEQAKKLLKLKERQAKEGLNIDKAAIDAAGVRFIWVRNTPTAGYTLFPEKLDEPKATCFVCQQKRVKVTVMSLKDWDLEHFISKVLKDRLGCEGEVTIQTDSGIIYDPDLLEDDPDLMSRNLAEVEVESGTILSVTAVAATAMSFDLIVVEDPRNPHFAEKQSTSAEDYECLLTHANENVTGTVMNAEYYREQERKQHATEAVDVVDDEEVGPISLKRSRSPCREQSEFSPEHKKAKRRVDGEDEC